MLTTLRAGRPTGASVLSRGKKCSFLQIVGTPTRWVSREQMLRHVNVNSPPNGLKLFKPPTKQLLHDAASWHSVKSRISSIMSLSFCMIIFSGSFTILTDLLTE